MTEDSSPRCSWCGRPLDPGDSWLLGDPAADRGAAFCRLEHVVPWALRGARWDPGAPPVVEQPEVCAHCGRALPGSGIVLLRRRAGHIRAMGFCSVDHLAAWAKGGGPWAGGGGGRARHPSR